MSEKYYKVKSLIPNMTFNILKKKDNVGNVDWFLSEDNHWHKEPDIDGYFTKTEINNISAVCRGIRPNAGGYKWRYSTEFGGGSDVSK